MPAHSPDEALLRRAIALADAHARAGEGGPFGAVIARDGVVVAEGWNQVVAACDPTAHAEIVAIRRATAALGDFALRGCVIYASAEPCPMCLAAIHWARLDAVVFAAGRDDAAALGFDDAFLYEELGRPLAERALRTSQALREEAVSVMRAWGELPDRVRY